MIVDPAVDSNYEVTTSRFAEPGRHVVCRELGPLTSKTPETTVVGDT